MNIVTHTDSHNSVYLVFEVCVLAVDISQKLLQSICGAAGISAIILCHYRCVLSRFIITENIQESTFHAESMKNSALQTDKIVLSFITVESAVARIYGHSDQILASGGHKNKEDISHDFKGKENSYYERVCKM